MFSYLAFLLLLQHRSRILELAQSFTAVFHVKKNRPLLYSVLLGRRANARGKTAAFNIYIRLKGIEIRRIEMYRSRRLHRYTHYTNVWKFASVANTIIRSPASSRCHHIPGIFVEQRCVSMDLVMAWKILVLYFLDSGTAETCRNERWNCLITSTCITQLPHSSFPMLLTPRYNLCISS